MKTKIEIKEPCSEDWNKMKIGLQSRFCDSCAKNVMDFTEKSREEILAYLLEHRDEQVCGRVYRSQLDYSNTDFLVTINALSKKQRNSNLSFYLLAMSGLMMAGCGENTPTKSTIQLGEVASVEVKALDIQFDKILLNTGTGNGTLKHAGIKPKPPKKKVLIENREKYLAYPKHTMVFEILNGDIAFSPNEVFLGTMIAPDQYEETWLFENNEPYRFVEKMPEFPSGYDNLMGYIKNNVKYPEWEQDERIEGTVVVKYVVSKEGKVKDIDILTSVKGAKNFDKEVIRLVKNMPDWVPGEKDGEQVDVWFTLPVRFKL